MTSIWCWWLIRFPVRALFSHLSSTTESFLLAGEELAQQHVLPRQKTFFFFFSDLWDDAKPFQLTFPSSSSRYLIFLYVDY